MSVAFRRESDDEHKEPVFERPIAPGPNLVTARGFSEIEARIAALDAEIAAAADEGERTTLRRELRYWQTRHATAEIMPAPSAGEVAFGSRVTVRQGGAIRTLTIVGGDEAVPAEGLIGFHAPLARALIGAAIGERIAFGGGMIEVLEIGTAGA